jgi:hypothetical protein
VAGKEAIVIGYLADRFAQFALIRGADDHRYVLFQSGMATIDAWDRLQVGDSLEFTVTGRRVSEARVTGRLFEPSEGGYA